jgi:hypothetical protein
MRKSKQSFQLKLANKEICKNNMKKNKGLQINSVRNFINKSIEKNSLKKCKILLKLFNCWIVNIDKRYLGPTCLEFRRGPSANLLIKKGMKVINRLSLKSKKTFKSKLRCKIYLTSKALINSLIMKKVMIETNQKTLVISNNKRNRCFGLKENIDRKNEYNLKIA